MSSFRTAIFVKEGHIGEVDVDTLTTADVVIEVGKKTSKVYYKPRYLPREEFLTKNLPFVIRAMFPGEWAEK